MILQEYLFVDDEGNYTEELIEGSYIKRICDTSASVGDLVTESNSIVHGVDVPVNNTDKKAIIGIIIRKSDPTTACVMTKGVITGLAFLNKSKKVYLSTTGDISSGVPSVGYLQVLGHAINDDAMDFNPANIHIKLT